MFHCDIDLFQSRIIFILTDETMYIRADMLKRGAHQLKRSFKIDNEQHAIFLQWAENVTNKEFINKETLLFIV